MIQRKFLNEHKVTTSFPSILPAYFSLYNVSDWFCQNPYIALKGRWKRSISKIHIWNWNSRIFTTHIPIFKLPIIYLYSLLFTFAENFLKNFSDKNYS